MDKGMVLKGRIRNQENQIRNQENQIRNQENQIGNQEKCINVADKIDDKCESLSIDELSIQNELLKDIMLEFDEKLCSLDLGAKFSWENFNL